jgi:hypothetical protein
MTKEWLSLLASIDKIRPEFLVALAGFSLFLLFSPTWLLQALGLLAVVATIKTWLGITLLLSLCLLATRAIGITIRHLNSLVQLSKSKQAIQQLTGEELGFLGEFIQDDVASIRAGVGDGLTGALMAKGLIFCASRIGDPLSGFPYGIQPWVRSYLQKRPDLWVEHTAARAQRRATSRGQFRL